MNRVQLQHASRRTPAPHPVPRGASLSPFQLPAFAGKVYVQRRIGPLVSAVMRQTTIDAVGGALLAIAGASMVVEAVPTYLRVIPRSPWILYVYLPIGSVLIIIGAVLLVRAQRRYEIERGRERGPKPPTDPSR